MSQGSKPKAQDADSDEIRVWSYLSEYNAERDEILRAVDEVFSSGTLILGDKGRELERRYAEYVGTSHAVGCDNGTNAIFLALKALNIGPGDEVITVANTAIPTVSAIVSAGATPVFVDVRPDTLLMDVDKAEEAVSERTKCVLPVHLFGQCVDMDPLLEMAGRRGLCVVEDVAQAHGADYRGRKAGSMGLVSATSFYPTKILGAYGDGGMITTDSDDVAQRLRRLRFYGAEKTYYAIEHGYNSRLDEVQAAILLTKLARIEQYIARRREIAAIYRGMLADSGLTLPTEAPYGRHAYYLFVVRHPRRDVVMERLRDEKIFTNISYPWPIHTMDAYRHYGRGEGSLPVTELASREIFSLPMYPSLTDDQVRRVCDTLLRILLTV